jgi:hypothetical protein
LPTWREHTCLLLEDDVPADVKQDRANEIMELQSQISWDLNQLKLGQTFKCIIDRKEGKNWIDPDVDNEVLIDASKHYLKNRRLCNDKIIEATEFWRTCLDFFSINQHYLTTILKKINMKTIQILFVLALMLLSIDTVSAQYENNG